VIARRIRPLETDREAPPARRPRPASEHAVVALQRAVGNAAVARLLARAPADLALPPGATHLAEYRQWSAGLRDLVKLGKPAVAVADIAAANLWLAKVVATLETAVGIGDRLDLHSESFLVHGGALESEYGAAEAELPELVRPVIERAGQTGTEIGALVISGINASSIAAADAAAAPALMPLAQVTEWRGYATRLHALGSTFTTMGVQDAAAACQDAALAMLQARSVASARTTWRAGNAIETTVAGAKDPHRARSAVDDIFADSGFSGRQTVEKVTNDAGVEVEQINDWCGMFVAAGMFRGAGLDKDLRKAFAHTDNVYDFFRYTAKVNDDRTPLSIWADGRWWLVGEYHQQRGSPRTWMEEGSIDLARIRPGDVALIRHKGTKPAKSVANHIVMVESFDAATGRLVTVEGNVHEGIRPDAAGEAVRQADGGLANSAAVRDSSVAHIRDMRDTTTLTPAPTGGAGPYDERGAKTVYGVGRPSLVDFEDHEYAKQPVPKALATLSPDEIRRKGMGALLQTPSTLDAAHAG
jgi:hypothetical protein